MAEPIRAFLDAALRWAPLDANRQLELANRFEMRRVEAGEALALPGDDRHDILFVAEGLLRFYYPGSDGRETNKAFVVEGEFAGAVASAQLGVPLLYGIEALEATTVLASSYRAFSELMDADPAFERLGRKLAETILARKERKARDLMLKSASERYADLLETRPDLVQRVPLYHLASYLGMTDVHLSRVRRELATI
ncbi:MAG: Crp/Fnr family transcriptional regulator [Bacteroidota bacterium]